MPHLVVLYTPDVARDADMGALCRTLADTLLAQRDPSGDAPFPVGGTRVFAVPATHAAVADGGGEYGFVYVNLRLARGRSAEVVRAAGDALAAAVSDHLAPLLAGRRIGVTLQIDESPGQVYDAKLGNLHALFR